MAARKRVVLTQAQGNKLLQFLEIYRTRHNYTRHEMCKMLAISQGTFRVLLEETPEHEKYPSLSTLQGIARWFNVPVEKIVGVLEDEDEETFTRTVESESTHVTHTARETVSVISELRHMRGLLNAIHTVLSDIHKIAEAWK